LVSKEKIMKMALMALVVPMVLDGPIAPSFGNDMDPGAERSGIVRCSLDGVNPAHHPEIFSNPAVAASYGFVRARDGTWHVQPNCRR
jgi:hypothetical protein